MLHQPAYMTFLWTLVRPFMKKKLRDRVHFFGSKVEVSAAMGDRHEYVSSPTHCGYSHVPRSRFLRPQRHAIKTIAPCRWLCRLLRQAFREYIAPEYLPAEFGGTLQEDPSTWISARCLTNPSLQE